MIYEKLSAIQSEVKAVKGQYNSFGKYKYRSCEDILEAVKPLLRKHKASITLTDKLVLIGDRYYVMATAELWDTEKEDSHVSVTAYAREAIAKKGMDESQVTGSCSSYARKYALAGLLLLDDNKDADTMDNRTSDLPFPEAEGKVTKVTEDDIKKIHQLMRVYPKETRETSLKLMLAKYKVDDMKDLNKADYVALLNEVADSAKDMLPKRLDNMICQFAKQGKTTKDKAKGVIEMGTGMTIDEVTVVTYPIFAGKFKEMYEGLTP